MKWYIKDGTFSKEASAGAQIFEVADDATHISIPDGVTTIAKSAFQNQFSLESVTIPDSVTTIEDSAFESCYELQCVNIPDSVVSIGDSAFSGGYELTELTIGNGVKHIGNQAFMGCDVLTELVIPDSVTDIGHSAFFYCSELKRVTVGSNLTQIGENAFTMCRSLTEVRFSNTWNTHFVESLDRGLLNQIAFITNDFENVPEELSLSVVFGFLYNISEFNILDKMNCFEYIMAHIAPTDSELSLEEIPKYFTAFVAQITRGDAEAADEIMSHFQFILDMLGE